MNLLYTITAYPPSTGGAQLYAHRLAQQQLLNQHNLQVVTWWNRNRNDWLSGTTLRAPENPVDYEIDGIHVQCLHMSRYEKLRLLPSVLFYYPLMAYALREIAEIQLEKLALYADHVDLVHNIRVGREGLSYASMLLARQKEIPFVFTPLHHPRWVGWRYKAYLDLYQQADAVIALTHSEKRTLASLGVAEDRIHVTGMAPVLADTVHPEHFLATHKIDGPVVLFVGQHYSYKGFKQLLEAAPLVWKQVTDATFVFIGPPVSDSEKHFATYNDPRIRRLGKVSLQEKSDALAACSLLCVPSTQESFGGVYTEAWSFGKAVIGCNIPAVAEVISDDVDGYLVKQEPKEIADCISYLLLNSTKAQTMGEKGQEKVIERYTWPKLAALTEQIYRKSIKGK